VVVVAEGMEGGWNIRSLRLQYIICSMILYFDFCTLRLSHTHLHPPYYFHISSVAVSLTLH